jgi:REP-associated tyrosine transposase
VPETWGQTGRSPFFVPIWKREERIFSLSIRRSVISDTFPAMARFARVVVADVAHHVTQRGNARQVILASDADRTAYLDLLRDYSSLYGLSLLGYCLMSNHVHLIAVPHAATALAQSLKQAHGRYAAYWNAKRSSTGHVWQGRFFSCPLDNAHLWVALRYVELNPVRAAMVESAEQWAWSSAAAHCGSASSDTMLEMERWRSRWTVQGWQDFLARADSASELSTLRHSTHTGRPLGSPEFVASLEESTSRALTPRKGGRPKRTPMNAGQFSIASVA